MSTAIEWLSRVAEAAAEARADQARDQAAQARLREKFANYMRGDLTVPTGKGTAAALLWDALDDRQFRERAAMLLGMLAQGNAALTREARHLVQEAGAKWARREVSE